MLKGTTYIVRPLIEPANSWRRRARISDGSSQLLVGLALGAHEGPVLDAGDVARIRCRPVRPGALGRIELDERARLDQLLAQQLVLLVRAFEPVDGVRLAESDHLVHPPEELLVASGWGVQRDGHNADSLRGNGSNSLPATAEAGRTVPL